MKKFLSYLCTFVCGLLLTTHTLAMQPDAQQAPLYMSQQHIVFISRANPAETLDVHDMTDTNGNKLHYMTAAIQNFTRVKDIAELVGTESSQINVTLTCRESPELIQEILTHIVNQTFPRFAELTAEHINQLGWLADDLGCHTFAQAISEYYAQHPERLAKRPKTFKEKLLTFNKQDVIDTDQLPAAIMADITKRYYCMHNEELMPQTGVQKLVAKITTRKATRQAQAHAQAVHYENLVDYGILPKIADYMTPVENAQATQDNTNVDIKAAAIIHNMAYLRNFTNPQSPYHNKLNQLPECPLAHALAAQAKIYANTHAHEAGFQEWFDIIKQNEIIVTAALTGITDRAKQEVIAHIQNNDMQTYLGALREDVFGYTVKIIAYVEYDITEAAPQNHIGTFKDIKIIAKGFKGLKDPFLLWFRQRNQPNAIGLTRALYIYLIKACLAGNNDIILYPVISLYGKHIKVLIFDLFDFEIPETIGQLKNLRAISCNGYPENYPNSMKKLSKLFFLRTRSDNLPAYLQPLKNKRYSNKEWLNMLICLAKTLSPL